MKTHRYCRDVGGQGLEVVHGGGVGVEHEVDGDVEAAEGEAEAAAQAAQQHVLACGARRVVTVVVCCCGCATARPAAARGGRGGGRGGVARQHRVAGQRQGAARRVAERGCNEENI